MLSNHSAPRRTLAPLLVDGCGRYGKIVKPSTCGPNSSIIQCRPITAHSEFVKHAMLLIHSAPTPIPFLAGDEVYPHYELGGLRFENGDRGGAHGVNDV